MQKQTHLETNKKKDIILVQLVTLTLIMFPSILFILETSRNAYKNSVKQNKKA